MHPAYVGLAGFFAGFLACNRVLSCIGSFMREHQQARAAAGATPKYLYAMLLFQSGPWLLAGSIAAVVAFFASTNPQPWAEPLLAGFGIGATIHLAVVGIAMFALSRKLARKRAQMGNPGSVPE